MNLLKKALNGLLSQGYGLDKDGVAALYNADGSDVNEDTLQKILDLDKERVAKLKPDTKKFFDDGFKKAQSEVLGAFEKSISDKYGFTSENKGIDLIDEIITSKQSNGTKLTDDDVKKHKAYIDLNESLNTKIQEVETTYQDKYQTLETQYKYAETFTKVKDFGLNILDDMKPVLPSDSHKANNLKNVFTNELNGYKFTLRDNNPVVLNDDGTDKTDEHGNRLKFNDVVKNIASKYFDFGAADDDKGGAGNKGDAGGGHGTDTVVKSEVDFVEKMKLAKTAEDKIALTESYLKLKQ